MSNIQVYNQKSKIAAALFAFFLGWLGAHRFYLNQPGRGVLYLLFAWTFIPSLISLIDFIMFLSMHDDQFDRKYNPQLYERRQLDRGRQGRNSGWDVQLPPPTNAAHRNAPPRNAPPQRNVERSEHEKFLREIGEIRNDIMQRIQSSKEFKKGVVSDIKPLVDNYIAQVRELIDRDKQVKQVIESHSLSDIDEKIFEINSKMSATTSPELKAEYRKSLDRYISHKKSLKEFYDQREMIKLRMDSTLMSLREVKFDLLRLQNLNSDEQRHEFFKLFDSKSTDLSDYLSSLKEAYNENRLD